MMNNLLFWLSRKINYPLVSPQVIQIPLTYKCNLQCKMCSIYSGPDVKKELSTGAIFDILWQAKDFGIKEVVLTGGEPFLRSDWRKVCDYCKELGLRAIVTTNGAVITEYTAGQIVGSGISHLHFSIDGLEENNDFTRGKGHFKTAIGAIETLDKLRKEDNKRLSIGIACTVMNHNVSDLAALFELADSIGVDVVNFQPLLKDNSDTSKREDTEFWVKGSRLNVLDEEIEKIKGFRARHVSLYEEPQLRLLSKYYRKNLSPSDWKCFGGYKTVFICIGDDEKQSPLVYTCHGICGSLVEKKLKNCWLSCEAKGLRKQVKSCRNLCLQSCYSRVNSSSFWDVLKKP